jgi:dTDP-4-amino-4,6-dideoxygalactose transaminase
LLLVEAMFIPWAPLLEIPVRRPRGPGTWEALFPSPAVVFTKGRFALLAGLRLLARERGLRRVWLPAFLCRGVVNCVVAAGLEPRLYDVTDMLEPRLDGIAPAAGDGLLIVHFFGVAVPIEACRAFAREHGMPLIEDCAHTLPAGEATGGPGAWGDVSVFSLRKMAPVPDGAVLVVKPPLSAAAAAPRGPRARIRDKLALMALERLAFTLGWNVLPVKERFVGQRLAAGEQLGGTPMVQDVGDAVPRPARLVLSILRRTDWPALIRRRQEAYRGLSSRLGAVPGLWIPVPALPAGSVPLGLPLLLDDATAVYHALRRAGIEAMRWPGFEQVRIEPGRYPGADEWLARGLCLPLGAPLGASRLDAVAGTLARQMARRPLTTSVVSSLPSLG